MKIVLLYLTLLIISSHANPYFPTLGCSGDQNLAFIRVKYNFVEHSACLNANDVVQDCVLFSIKKDVQVYGLALIGDLSCIDCYNTEMFVAPTTTGVNSCIREIHYVPNCAKYTKIGMVDNWLSWACSTCNAGLRVNGVGKCSPIVNKCSLYTPYGVCIGCVFNYQLKGNICVEKVVETPAKPVNPDAGCLTEVQIGTCPKCKSGYVLVDKVCLSIKDNAENIDKALGQCQPNEIRMQTGKCALQLKNCHQYNQDGLCLRCKEGYQFTDDLGSCEKIEGPSVEDLCPAIDEGDLKYVLVKGECVKVDKNCVEANEDGCINCEDGYFLYEKKCYFINFEEEVAGNI